MSNMNKKTRDILYPRIVEKQKGAYCMDCKRDPFILLSLAQDPKLCIDHIDNNNNNNSINNLQLLCKSCNTKKNHPRIEPFERKPTPEYHASKRNLIKARKYIAGLMFDSSNNNALNIEELVNDLAEYLDCSQQAVKNYIAKFCSKKHGLYTTENRNGEDYLVFKNDSEMEIVMKEFRLDNSEVE